MGKISTMVLSINKKWVMISGLLLLTVITLAIVVESFYIPQGTIAPGVSILNVDVGGLPRQMALKKVDKVVDSLLYKPVILNIEDEKIELSPVQFGASANLAEVMDEAFKLGKKGSLFQQWKERRKLATKGVDLQPRVSFDEKKLTSKLITLATEFDQKPKDARLIFTQSNEMQVIAEEPGKKILLKKTILEINKTLLKKDRDVKVAIEIIIPRLTQSELKQLNFQETIATFSTKFDQSNTNRVHNIKIAAQAINGYVIFPDEVFSFNQVVGSRTRENDYKESLIIVDNEFVPGTGGGVCQVSSTLYNVALLTDMNIVERRNHSRPVGYLPLGLDATVLDNKIDLKFKNTAGFPLAINATVKGDAVKIKFLGEKLFVDEVKIYTTDVEEVPPGIREKEEPGLPKGEEILEEGKPGYRLTVWREVINDGKVVKKEKLSNDSYNVIDSVLYIGRGEEAILEDILPLPN